MNDKKSVRVWSNVSEKVNQEIADEAEKRGLSKSSVIRERILLNKN